MAVDSGGFRCEHLHVVEKVRIVRHHFHAQRAPRQQRRLVWDALAGGEVLLHYSLHRSVLVDAGMVAMLACL